MEPTPKREQRRVGWPEAESQGQLSKTRWSPWISASSAIAIWGFRPESYDVYFVCHCSRVLASHLLIPARSDSFLRTHKGSSTRVRIAHRESKELTACQYPVFRATRECAGPRKVVDYVTSRENATPRNTKRINRALPGSKSKLRRMPIYGTCR
jgi:hypothetical protein